MSLESEILYLEQFLIYNVYVSACELYKIRIRFPSIILSHTVITVIQCLQMMSHEFICHLKILKNPKET